ncbi:MAG: leucine-rich repeat protein, partial [Lachnospiraceae bacterium]
VICGYNDTYSVPELSLSSNVITGYEIVSQETYNAYVTNTINQMKITLDVSPYKNGTATVSLNAIGSTVIAENLTIAQTYFPVEYEAWRQQYDTALSNYKTQHPEYVEDPAHPIELSLIGMSPLVLEGAKMTDENKRLYYCAHNTGNDGVTDLNGYTLVSVRNYARDLVYIDGQGNRHNIPDEDRIYVATPAAGNATADKLDANNFKYLNSQGVAAIGDQAFKDTQKVTNMTVGEGIAYIGDEAFLNSFIHTVKFESVDYIGNRVFKNCQYLEEIELGEKTTLIGKEAFYGCLQLKEVSIPTGVKALGFGAFAECPVLKRVDLSRNLGIAIGEYAFYNCPYLEEIIYPADYEVSIGKAAFALSADKAASSHLTTFRFPDKLTGYVVTGLKNSSYSADTNGDYSKSSGYRLYDETGTGSYNSRLGDYILANRLTLQEVTFSPNFGSGSQERIPMNTFAGCTGLGCVRFAKNNNWLVRYDSNLFEDVENPNLYVYGPENTPTVVDGSSYALPRRSTWVAHTRVADYVPYVYTSDVDNTDHYEVGISPYRYELKINEEGDGTATLLSCKFIESPEDIDVLIVPSIVAEYTITDMASGCMDDIKDYILKLVVADNSLRAIGDNVFSDCAKLNEVTLGNSVESIGVNAFSDNDKLEVVTIGAGIETVDTQAFADCPILEKVVWDAPSNYGILTTIADDAFDTGSEKLYFYGDIDNSYQPFLYAMGDHAINDDSVRICYAEPVSSDPSTFDVAYYTILDEETGDVLLIDYPHYMDLPQSTRDKYEGRGSVSDPNLNNSEQTLLNATLFLSVPKEVTSIDVKSFLEDDANNTNRKNWRYIDDSSSFVNSGTTQRTLYTDDTYMSYEDGYHAGLFSGYYLDDQALAAYGEETATINSFQSKGNDWIRSLELPGVTEIPDYAFDSCERLQSLIISNACQEIGTLAFQNCDQLTSIGTGDSTKYTFQNYVLYDKLGDGTYEINVCLPGRGSNHEGTTIWMDSENDPLLSQVSSVKDGAFNGCENIVKVDLGDSTIHDLPENTFAGCKALSNVVLPNTIRNIGSGAFTGNSTILDVTVPCDTLISDTAFDKTNTVTIWTYPECELTSAYDPAGYNNIYIRFLDEVYTITYYNDDLTVFERIEVTKGSNGYYPETDPSPRLASHQGFKFDSWNFDHPDEIKNVTENRQAVATFVDPLSSNTYTITYLNDDMTVYETVSVLGGYNGYYPETNPSPKLAIHSGYLFSGWNFDNANKINNVTEDRQAIATFSPTGSASSNTPDNSGNTGNNGNNSNNGSNGNNSGNNNNNGSTSNNSTSNNSASNNNAGKTYNVVVENGAGSGSYEPGKVVTITAYAPATNRVFDRWTTSNTDIGFANAYGVSTTFIMPTHDVKVTATYKQQTTSSNSTSQNNTNNNTNNSNNNSSSNNGTNNNPSNNGGTDVTVTTETIDNNHKNLVSATVSGSTDNFVLKITDSASAYAAVEQALRAQYGDLTNIRFVGFDISLYDETGTVKVPNTDGLAVTITLPIPDELVPYAGNNKAAGVVNGVLDPMTVKFTTIDGVPCMQFTATHFSPYTIYVNTDTMTMGVTDTTPKTGDGIHPKWFLAAGLVCISGVLFAWKDKKRVTV